jgi:hypothetical protein
MNAGIGSTRAVDPYPLTAADRRQDSFELALNGSRTELQLEAGKVGPVIFDPRAVTNGAALSGDLCLRPAHAGTSEA